MRLVSLIYQGLVRIGADLKPAADLAHKWSVDGDMHTFYISQKTKFSDGSSLTCKDLKQSITNYQDKKCPFNSAFKNITDLNCSTSAPDFVLSFNTPTDSEKFLLADLPVLKIKKGELGTGAFTISENEPTHTILKKNSFNLTPQEYDLKFFYLKDDLARFLKVYKGEIDIAPNSIPFEKVRSFSKTKMKVLEKPSLSTAYILINFKNKALQNLDTRKTIYSALNIPELVEHRFDNHVTLAKSLLSPEHPYYSKNLKNLHHQGAKKNISIPKLTFKTSNARQTRETGKIMSYKFKNSGIETNLQSFEWGTFYKDVKNGRFDIALMKWVGVVDPDLYNLAFHSSEFPPGRNRGYYNNPSLDSTLELGRKSKSQTERIQTYTKAQDTVFKDLAIIPLWHENQIHIVHPRIKKYKLNPMGDFTSFLNLNIERD
ncbi:MAG: ABC transporter substrate-binding protein [Bdellovibrionales bacterium]